MREKAVGGEKERSCKKGGQGLCGVEKFVLKY